MKLYDIQQEIFKYFRKEETNPGILSETALSELGVYETLILNSMEDFMQKAYSLSYEILEDNWQEIISLYLAKYPSKSPIFYLLAKDFPDFLASTEFQASFTYPNYLAELALYEWTELELYNAKLEISENGLNSVHKILELKYPISQVIAYLKNTDDDIEAIRSTDIEEEAENLLVLRDPETNENRFFVLASTSLEFINGIKSGQPLEIIRENFREKFQGQLSGPEINLAMANLIEQLKKMKMLLQ